MANKAAPKKTAKRTKHVPQRTCVGCRETLSKRALIRVVRTPQGVQVDPTGKLAGRGAYLHDQRACWQRGLKGGLAHALKVELTHQDREGLSAFMSTLPAESEMPDSEMANSGYQNSEHSPQPTQPTPRHVTGSEEIQAHETGLTTQHGSASLPEPDGHAPETAQ